MKKPTLAHTYVLLLLTVVTVGSSYAAQDSAVVDYIASFRISNPDLPNVPNQKGTIGAIFAEIFDMAGKIKPDYLDLSGVGGGGVAFTGVSSVNARTGAVTLTSSDVGLGNVQNTALSTWAGSSNISTLGTVTSGVWNATNISPAKIATDTTNRFITDAERASWNAKVSSETDSKVGSLTANIVPKWGVSTLVNGSIYDTGGNVGIGTSSPNVPLQVRSGTDKNLYFYGTQTLSSGSTIASVNDANSLNMPLEIRGTTIAVMPQGG